VDSFYAAKKTIDELDEEQEMPCGCTSEAKP
jgi:hypothetical protein